MSRHNARSVEAYEASRAGASARRLRILRALYDYPDICDSVETRLDMAHQSCSAEMSTLAAEGLIVKTGERRRTRHGRSADVYRLTPEACAILDRPPTPAGGIPGQVALF